MVLLTFVTKNTSHGIELMHIYLVFNLWSYIFQFVELP